MKRSEGTTDALPSHACPRVSRSAPLPASCQSEDQASGSHSFTAPLISPHAFSLLLVFCIRSPLSKRLHSFKKKTEKHRFSPILSFY